MDMGAHSSMEARQVCTCKWCPTDSRVYRDEGQGTKVATHRVHLRGGHQMEANISPSNRITSSTVCQISMHDTWMPSDE